MFSNVFPYLIQQFSRIVTFVFNLQINENPNITFGEFILACAFIGFVLYFIFGSDFLPNIGGGLSGFSSSKSTNTNSNGYQPRHAYTPRHGKDK